MPTTVYLFIPNFIWCFSIISLNIICKGGLCASGNIFALVKVSWLAFNYISIIVFFLFGRINISVCLSVYTIQTILSFTVLKPTVTHQTEMPPWRRRWPPSCDRSGSANHGTVTSWNDAQASTSKIKRCSNSLNQTKRYRRVVYLI